VPPAGDAGTGAASAFSREISSPMRSMSPWLASFATALQRAANEASHGLIERIGEEISRLNALAAPVPASPAGGTSQEAA